MNVASALAWGLTPRRSQRGSDQMRGRIDAQRSESRSGQGLLTSPQFTRRNPPRPHGVPTTDAFPEHALHRSWTRSNGPKPVSRFFAGSNSMFLEFGVGLR